MAVRAEITEVGVEGKKEVGDGQFHSLSFHPRPFGFGCAAGMVVYSESLTRYGLRSLRPARQDMHPSRAAATSSSPDTLRHI